MKKNFFLLSIFFFSSLIFAETKILNLNFVNHTIFTANAALFEIHGHHNPLGPLVNNNGSTAHWEFSEKQHKQFFIGFNSDHHTAICSTQNHNTTLNLNNYQGDPITITYTGFNIIGRLQCTCTGSACDTQPKT